MTTTKEKIIKEGMKLFAQKGYGETSMAEIAKASGIEKASLYYFFDSKETLLVQILESIWKKLVDDIEKMCDKREDYKSNRAHFSAIVQYFINNSLEGGVILGRSDDLCIHKPSVFKGIFKHIARSRKLLRDGLKKYKAASPEVAEQMVINACHAYIMHKQYCKRGASVKKYADYISSIIIKD